MISTPPFLLNKIVRILEDKKALNVQILDVREIITYADFIIICSGTSNTHVAALVSNVEDAFTKQEGPLYTNSSKDDSWWILDFVEVVVHVFREDVQHYYDLEGLWSDAKRVLI